MKHRKWWIGNNYIGFIAQCRNFSTTKIAITFQILPLQVVYIYPSVGIGIVIENKYFTTNTTGKSGLI